MLTEKQEAFVRLLLEGNSQAQAYRGAYDAAGMSDETVYKEASKLARRSEIRKRLDTLRQELENAAIATVRERLILLTDIISTVSIGLQSFCDFLHKSCFILYICNPCQQSACPEPAQYTVSFKNQCISTLSCC